MLFCVFFSISSLSTPTLIERKSLWTAFFPTAVRVDAFGLRVERCRRVDDELRLENWLGGWRSFHEKNLVNELRWIALLVAQLFSSVALLPCAAASSIIQRKCFSRHETFIHNFSVLFFSFQRPFMKTNRPQLRVMMVVSGTRKQFLSTGAVYGETWKAFYDRTTLLSLFFCFHSGGRLLL